MTKKLETDYEALQSEIFAKLEQAKKLLLEANKLVPKAKIMHPDCKDIGELPVGFVNDSNGFCKPGGYDDYSDIARDLADLDELEPNYENSMYRILSKIGWQMSSIGC